MGHALFYIARYGGLVGLVVAGVWIGQEPTSVEPYFTAVAASIAAIATDLPIVSKLTNKGTDRQLFKEFVDEVPADKMLFMRDFDFGGAFNRNQTDFLGRYDYYWVDAHHEFLDSKLEAKRKAFSKLVFDFNRELAVHTVPVGTHGMQRIPENWSHEKPDLWREVSDKLNNLATAMCTSFDDVVRTARPRLGVEEPAS